MSDIKNSKCTVVDFPPACNGWSCDHLPKHKSWVLHYFVITVIVIALTVSWVAIGQDKGCKRADIWYACLHKNIFYAPVKLLEQINMNRIKGSACCIARCLGTSYVWCSKYLPKLKSIVLHYVVIQVLVTALTVAYVEIGHDKGWKRADVWYTCLHTHHHFPWQ